MFILKVSVKYLSLAIVVFLMISWASAKTVIFKNVNVIPMTSDTVLEHQDVYIKGARIEVIVPTGTGIQEDVDIIIDGEGKYLIPGLADMHVHLYLFDHGGELPLFLANGVTTVKDCNGNDHILEFRDEIADGRMNGPRIYCSTPTISGTEDEPWKLVEERYGKGYDAVKLYSYFDSRGSFDRTMTEAKRLGAYTLGHTPYTVGLEGIIEEGMEEIAHVEEICWEFADIDRGQNRSRDTWLDHIVESYIKKYSAMEPEELRSALNEEAKVYARKIAKNDIIVSTTCHYTALLKKKIFETAEFARNPNFKYLSPEYFISLGMGREKHIVQFGGIEDLIGTWSTMVETMLRALRDEGVLLTAGTDAIWFMGLVPGFSLHEELEYFVGTGFTPYEALRTATVNAGEAGRRIEGIDEADFGTVEAKKRADLVLLEGNPLEDISNTKKISGVMANGRWYAREEIEAMLEFDPEVHQAQLDLFEACLALKKGDALPLDEFMESTNYIEAKNCLYSNRRTMTALMVNLHNQEMDEKVAAYFDEAIKKNWDSVNFLNAISWTVAVEKEIEKLYPSAIAAAKRALELYRHPAMLETLARLYALSGDYDKAFESIDEAMTIDPGNKRYENTCAKITKMKEG